MKELKIEIKNEIKKELKNEIKKNIIFNEKDCWRLGIHLMPITGWLNDPNGLCWYKGEYHVFFQYSPDDPKGGLKHWGHYKSKDMLCWEYAGIAISPEHAFEKHGIYSGTAYTDEDGMHLFYTGNVKLDGDYNYITDGRQGNTIYLSSKDGIHFEEKQCVLPHEEYPENLTCHIRDPKVWAEFENGQKQYFMLLGARTLEDQGEVLLYQSPDMKKWQLESIITTESPMGFMWECPDTFTLANKQILAISPQGIESQKLQYQNIYQSGYFITEKRFTEKLDIQSFKEWDRGFDFYAPQTFEAPDGRRILIGWMGMPDVPEFANPTIQFGWQHALTLPRELVLDGDKVLQKPVHELRKLRTRQLKTVEEKGTKYKCYEAEISDINSQPVEFTLENELKICYNPDTKIFSIQFLNQSSQSIGQGRTSRSVYLTNCDKIHLFVDRSCIEIFINGGQEVFTTRFYPANGKSMIDFGAFTGQEKIWELKQYELIEIN